MVYVTLRAAPGLAVAPQGLLGPRELAEPHPGLGPAGVGLVGLVGAEKPRELAGEALGRPPRERLKDPLVPPSRRVQGGLAPLPPQGRAGCRRPWEEQARGDRPAMKG